MTIIDRAILRYIEEKLFVTIVDYQPVSGGSINETYCLLTTSGKYFVKINSRTQHPGMFIDEAAGLNLIAETKTIAVPKVLFIGDTEFYSFLLLEWVDTERPSPQSFTKLGVQLAQMHRYSSGFFGLDHDNYMGSLRQSNPRHNNWSDFFIQERLQPMVKIGMDKGFLNAKDLSDFEVLYKKLPGLFTEEKPSLIHGDLWGGNYLISNTGTPYLIDPAVSYGNREFDIAMTTLFGGFGREFYRVYHEKFPLNKGWEQRMDLWNLYPLLVHLNLFGAGYLRQLNDCLRKFL